MKKKNIMKIGESIFCIFYLIFALIAGIMFLKNNFFKYSILTLTLGFGDAFHLIPRIIKNIVGNTEKVQWWMNLGLIITSITMTIFYVLLFYIWKIEYNGNISIIIPILIWFTSLIRIGLCLLPQNKWFRGGNKKMSLCRNLVFFITGLIEVILFIMLNNKYGIIMGICILLSFVFYMPVALFGKENPKLGMLMIPKTLMYIIMISLGLSLL